MPRETASKFQLIEVPINVGKPSNTSVEVQTYYKKAGARPGFFFVDPQTVVVDNQEITLKMVKHTDIQQLCNLVSKHIEQHISKETLDYFLHIRTDAEGGVEVPTAYQLINYDCATPKVSSVYLASNSQGLTYRASSKTGDNSRLVYENEIEEIENYYVKVEEDTYRELKYEFQTITDKAKAALESCREQYKLEIESKWREFCDNLNRKQITPTASDQDLSAILQSYSK